MATFFSAQIEAEKVKTEPCRTKPRRFYNLNTREPFSLGLNRAVSNRSAKFGRKLDFRNEYFCRIHQLNNNEKQNLHFIRFG